MSATLFVIVGKEPLYTADLRPQTHDSAHLNQFVIHSSLDIVDEIMWKNNTNCALKVVDQFNDQFVSAFVTPTGMKFMLLHDNIKDSRNEDGIRLFFQEVHELFIKIMLNPFYKYNTPITSTTFDTRIKSIAKRILTV